ncbi:lycopene cyclase family protein [Balneolaceae bacterium ANBcel3]|nr:lycopene cyclase family protein [Balneolaceae bacterium ANBcel3]
MAIQNDKQFDFIIAGAGAAGLSLLRCMADDPFFSDKRILLADRSVEPKRDKTWCFWQKEKNLPESFLFKTWDSLEVFFEEESFSEQLSEYSYACIRSDVYAEKVHSAILDKPNISVLETEIHSFGVVMDQGIMNTGNGEYRAPFIFQSALKPVGFDAFKVDLSLKQHFLGWHIKANRPLFDPGKATFMDFKVLQQDGVTFVYVLPFHTHEALVEYTVFSENVLPEEVYSKEIQEYIKKRYGCSEKEYEIVYKESGVIPMEDRRYASKYNDRVYNIGIVGGAAKPSTGYTFSRIQKQSKEIVEMLKKGVEPELSDSSPYRYRAYDMLLLYQLAHHPEKSLRIFRYLFKNNSMDSVLRFLDESGHFGQDLSIMYSVPWYPFFQSIWKMRKRLITGA